MNDNLPSRKPPAEALERIVQEITQAQPSLYTYACALLGGPRDVPDVLQEANLVLWRKAAEYDPARPFLPWAYGIVFRQVLAHREKTARDRHVFSASVMEQLSERFAQRNEDLQAWTEALTLCLERLPARQRTAIQLRYHESLMLDEIAARTDCNTNIVKTLLYRGRLALAQCVKRALTGGGSP